MSAHNRYSPPLSPHALCLTHSQILPFKVLRVLLSHDLNSLVPDANGWTPFCYALWKENTPCVLELLKVSDDNSLKQFGVRHIGCEPT